MTQYQRKPKTVEAFQWERNSDPKTWPEWARLYRAQDGMGSLSGLATSGVGTLLIPALPSSKHAESGQWLVFEGEIVEVEGGARVARGPVLVMTTDQFEAEFVPVGPARNAPEPAPEAPAAETVTEVPTETPAADAPAETPPSAGENETPAAAAPEAGDKPAKAKK